MSQNKTSNHPIAVELFHRGLKCWTESVVTSKHVSFYVIVSLQQEAADCDPLDELYDALAEVVGAEDMTECYKSYLLVPAVIIHCITARLLGVLIVLVICLASIFMLCS